MGLVRIKLIDGGKMPEYKSDGAACADAYARLSTPYIMIPQGARCLINLGFAVELPYGYEMEIRPRSGLSERGLDVAQGTCDWDFRGEVKACVINNTGGEFVVNNLDRICQLKIQQAEQFSFLQVDELSETERGEGGWGSTGVSG